MAEASAPVEVFCCYSHADKLWLRKLETHLSLLQRQGLISLWHDRLIPPGTDWAHTIDTHLETASVILLLVSADFLASDYCYGIEMKRALERHAANEARVVPILVRPVDWTNAPFAHLQALPTDAKPIASWQSKERALVDVTSGIRRTIQDVPLLAASAPRAALPTIWNIPYARNPFFLGRESELAQVRQQLQAGRTTALSQPQAISGLGGIGKTQLALEYAYRYHQDYTVVLWARAESVEALISSYVALATLLRLPERDAEKQEITVQAVKTWLQTHRGWLLILDNADELALLPDVLPPTLGGHLLLTTRAAATGRLAHRLEIETLLPKQGALFLLRRAAILTPDAELSQASPQEQELAVQINQELGGLPLALDQAGAYLEETGVDLGSYWQMYQQHRADLLHKRGGLVADHPAPVATTWSLSFQKVQKQQPAATELLRLCAFLAPDAISEEILTTGASFLGPILQPVAANPFLLNQAIEALRTYSLVRRDPGRKVLSIHRLVQAVLLDELEEEERHRWVERAVLAINAAFPDVKHANWPQCERLLPHALLAAQFIETKQISHSGARRLLYQTGAYLKARARYHEAELLYKRALTINEQQLGTTHPETASSLNDLASLYKNQGKYGEAESLYQRALTIKEQVLDSNHPSTAISLNNLADLYDDQGKYEEAEPLYQRALTIKEQVLGPNHPSTATSLHNLAVLYSNQERYEEAEPLYQRALAIKEQVLGSNHPSTASTLNNLAVLYSNQERYEEAEPLYQRALAIREMVLGSEHPDVAYSLYNLANFYHDQGKYVEAEPLYQRALGIREQQLGPEHPQVAYPLDGLATLYRKQNKYAEAEPLYQRALDIREQQLGPEHPQMAEIMHGFAECSEAQGNLQKAASLYQRALAIREQAFGTQHPKTTETRRHFIALLHALGQHEQAAQLELAQAES
jgi:tetratricopeptide (TPR) repeat protein